ncbi:MAG: class I SAM-dependent methyltransferase [Candidatus Delongbacteria bacterium]|nr:class I SAM-dependent methyltransferase [Candidatus Delongbacteria bacterium]MBN2835908.1 class I SAM-dependent methyltransferase [Candidatus Delongbacteria bacterium]
MVSKCIICESSCSKKRFDNQNFISVCSYCGHVYRNLEECPAGSRYSPWGGNSLFDKFRNNLTFNDISRSFSFTKGSILELGFGSGYLLGKMYSRGFNVSGIDKELLGIKIDKEIKENAKLYFGDLETTELPENEYDLVYGIHLIEHISNLEKVLIKIFKSLKNDGKIYFLTPTSDSLGLKIFGKFWWNFEDPTHYNFYSSKSIYILLEKCGFKNIQISYPSWDSLTVEINSLIRMISKNHTDNGVLSGKLTLGINLLLLPFAFILRLFFSKISPTMKIIAIKE